MELADKEKKQKVLRQKQLPMPTTPIEIAIPANTPDLAETLLHSVERAAAGIGLYVNAHKTECMCYNQTGDNLHSRRNPS